MAYQSIPGWRLIAYSFLPSWTSLTGVILGSLLFIGGHLLLLSVAAGTIFTTVWDGSLSLAYTNYIVRPLLYLFNLGNFGIMMNLLVWGLVGWFVFSLGERATRTVRDWHETEEDILVSGRQVIHHPLRQDFIVRTMWQLACVAGFTLLAVQAPSILSRVLGIDRQIFAGQPASAMLTGLMEAVLLCSLLGHCIIVLLRLYSFRTRLTDTPHYQ